MSRIDDLNKNKACMFILNIKKEQRNIKGNAKREGRYQIIKKHFMHTLSMILSMTSSERFIPDSASVATTICFTWAPKLMVTFRL